ncbi:MAG: hypothetical protein AAF614_00065 [Chloroflexota bacterium]
MSFLANLNSFFLANEVAVVTVVAVSLVLFQLALLASAFLSETAVASANDNVDGDGDEETAVVPDNYDLWAAHAYMPYMF